MEMTMNMSAFEQLDNREMVGVDGGKVTFAGLWDSVCKGATSAAAGCIAASFVPGGAPSYLTAGVVAAVCVYVWDNL